jgi:hypothetical protein
VKGKGGGALKKGGQGAVKKGDALRRPNFMCSLGSENRWGHSSRQSILAGDNLSMPACFQISGRENAVGARGGGHGSGRASVGL